MAVAYTKHLAILYWKCDLSDVKLAKLPPYILRAWHHGLLHLDRDGIVYHSSRGEIRVEWGDYLLDAICSGDLAHEIHAMKSEIFHSLFEEVQK
jgi:hypothetical protein